MFNLKNTIQGDYSNYTETESSLKSLKTIAETFKLLPNIILITANLLTLIS